MPKTNNPDIKWRKQDREKLRRLVKNFNAKLTRITKKNPAAAAYLPQKLTMKQVKGWIGTRKDFNRTVKSLQRFAQKGAEAPVKNKFGIITTKWAVKETAINTRIANAQKKRQESKMGTNPLNKKQRIIEETGEPLKNGFEKKKSKKSWENFQEQARRRAKGTFWKEKANRYLTNYKIACDNNLGIYSELVKRLATKFGGLNLYDAYYVDDRLQIDYLYTQMQIELKVIQIMDAFELQGVSLSAEEETEFSYQLAMLGFATYDETAEEFDYLENAPPD